MITLSCLVSLKEVVNTCDTESWSTAQYKVHTDPARVEQSIPPTTEAHNELIAEIGTAAHFIQTTVCPEEVRLPHFDAVTASLLPSLRTGFTVAVIQELLPF